MADREQRIRERAYQIWKDEGEPEGRYDDHWLQAERELDLEEIGLDDHEDPNEVRDVFRDVEGGTEIHDGVSQGERTKP